MPIGHWSIDNCDYYLFILQVKLNSLIYLICKLQKNPRSTGSRSLCEKRSCTRPQCFFWKCFEMSGNSLFLLYYSSKLRNLLWILDYEGRYSFYYFHFIMNYLLFGIDFQIFLWKSYQQQWRHLGTMWNE